jgi:hypothetical protein
MPHYQLVARSGELLDVVELENPNANVGSTIQQPSTGGRVRIVAWWKGDGNGRPDSLMIDSDQRPGRAP